MLSMKVNLICIFILMTICYEQQVSGAELGLTSGSNQQTNLGLNSRQLSGKNWLNTYNLQSMEHIAREDSDDYKVIASGLMSRLSSIKTIDDLNEFVARLRNFADRNNYLTSTYLRDNRPIYMEEYNTRVDPRKYAGLEVVASILNSSDAKSLLVALRNGDYKIMSDLFSDYVRLDKQQQHNSTSSLEQALLAKADKYPLLMTVFKKLLATTLQQ